jgi:homoprotocatechuate degradation regulator HpaR
MTPPDDAVTTAPVTRLRGFEAALPIALLRARAATAHKFKRHTDAEGLTQPQWRVLRALAAGEPLDSKTLADRCALLQPSLSRIFRSLTKRGLIIEHDSTDFRSRFFKLTQTGQDIFDRVAVISEAVYRDIENVYGREDLIQLLQALNRLRTVCDALPDLPMSMPADGRKP